MMSRIVCLMMIFGLACGATWRGKVSEKPMHLAHKEGCYIEEIKDVIPYGEMITPVGHCYRIECLGSTIEYASCGVIAIAEGSNCYFTNTNYNRPYPDCCPEVKCDVDNNLF